MRRSVITRALAGAALAGLAALTVTVPPAGASALATYDEVISPSYIADYCNAHVGASDIGFYRSNGTLGCYRRNWHTGAFAYVGGASPSSVCQYYALPGYTVYSVYHVTGDALGCRFQN
ncbi:hypothetical protein [Rhizohabitans arisaemae]|uniref:hypothetical protein n=1 Tax=Rhizohabitans arisaemae TaxID=2720610 RepID=UPI0024B040A8|nr:hypothetical protein [Rhizohabitans arisaemae]